MSFIDAYEGSGISFTLEEAKIIVEGKRNRNIRASLPIDEVVRYQEMELRILCRMMDKLRQTTDSLGLDLPHWHGAGSISMAMANKHRARDFYPNIRSINYLPVQEWAHCFAGGHIEMIMQGRCSPHCVASSSDPHSLDDLQKLYGYDITSAYPSKQFVLPAMALPIEWELKKDGSLGKVIKRIEGKFGGKVLNLQKTLSARCPSIQ